MAEERVSDIVIPIRYELHDEGYKKVNAQLEALGSAKGVRKINTEFSSLSKTFKETRNTFTQTEKSIVDQINKTSKSLNTATEKWKAYEKARDAVAAYKRGRNKNKLKYSLAGLNDKVSKKDAALSDYLEAVGVAKVEYQNLLTRQDQYNTSVAESEWKEREALIKENAQKQIDAEKQVEAEREQLRERNRKGYISWWEDQLKAQDEAVKAQIDAEKQAAEAAKQAAKEQEEAKERVRKAWQNLGDAFKKPVENFRKGVRTLASTLYVIRRFVSFFKAMAKEVDNLIQASSSWIENLNLLEVVFGDVSDNAEKTKEWVDGLARTMSMDKNAIVQYVSTFKQMANAMGQAADTGERMSEVLTMLGLDIASLRNVKTETAMSDLASAIAGQIKPVRKYGFDVSLQSINAMLKESGIGGTVTQLSQADKQLARTILLIRQSQDAWGDMGKTINTFANQQRIMNDQFETTKRLLGQVFIGTFQFGDSLDQAKQTAGIATKAIWYINGALIAFNSILEAILPNADSVNGGIAAMSEEAQDEIEDMNDALEGSLASFDKFNVMSQSSGNGAGAGTTLDALFNEEAAKYLKDWQERAAQIQSYAKEIANDLLGKLFPEFAEFNKDGTKSFVEWARGSKTAQAALSKLTEPIVKIKETLEEAFERIDIIEVLNAIAQIILAVVKVVIALGNALVKISNLLGTDGIVGLLKAIVIILVTIKGIQIVSGAVKGISTITKSLQALLPVLKGIFSYSGSMIMSTKDMILGLGQAFLPIIVSIGVLAIGITTLVKKWGDMSKTARILVPVLSTVAGVITAIAVAIHMAKSVDLVTAIVKGAAVGAAVTGVGLAVGSALSASINKHAEGGYQTGGLFYAGENGAEWIGRQGNTSTIINDKQMSDIMQQSVAMGVVQGNRMSNAGRTTGGDGKVAVVNLDGKRLFEVVQQNGRKVGKVFAEA